MRKVSSPRRRKAAAGPMETYRMSFPGAFKAAKAAKSFAKRATKKAARQVKSDYNKYIK